VGKTTVCALIKHKLESRDLQVVLTTTPSSSKIAQLARHGTYDFHGAALTCLVAADRYQHERTTVRPSIEQGAVVGGDDPGDPGSSRHPPVRWGGRRPLVGRPEPAM
jgi:thymidylate kinase